MEDIQVQFLIVEIFERPRCSKIEGGEEGTGDVDARDITSFLHD